MRVFDRHDPDVLSDLLTILTSMTDFSHIDVCGETLADGSVVTCRTAVGPHGTLSVDVALHSHNPIDTWQRRLLDDHWWLCGWHIGERSESCRSGWRVGWWLSIGGVVDWHLAVLSCVPWLLSCGFSSGRIINWNLGGIVWLGKAIDMS